MKILIATGLYPPEIGGPATYTKILESELPLKGIEVLVVPFALVRGYPKIIRHALYAYKVWQESKTADIVYALDPISVGIPALLIATLRQKPFLLRLGGDYAWEQGRVRFGMNQTLDEYLAQKTKPPIMVSLLAILQTFVAKRAKYVIAPSEYLKSVITAWGVSPEKTIVVYSAVSSSHAKATIDEIRTQHSLRYPTIVSAGRLVPWKGFEALINVVAILKETYPNILLVIAGDGEEKERLNEKIVADGLEHYVRLTGRLSKEVLCDTIKAADIFILNTAYEGLSHQLIEVMDIGTPIITTPAGGNPELITDKVTGLLVEFNNVVALSSAVRYMLEHEVEKTTMTDAAYNRSKDFSQSIMIEKISNIFKKIHESTIN